MSLLWSLQAGSSAKVRIEGQFSARPVDVRVVSLEPRSPEHQRIFMQLYDVEDQLFAVWADFQRQRRGLVRDGAGSPIKSSDSAADLLGHQSKRVLLCKAGVDEA